MRINARSVVEQRGDLLDIIHLHGRRTLTRISALGNYNFERLKAHLAYLQDRGFVVHDRRGYTLTAEGVRIMGLYHELRKNLAQGVESQVISQD